jgi:sarcosine reductase
MKLELADFPVKNVRFSKQTSYKSGVLEINKEELKALVLEDKKIASADLDVAFPNEKTRIVFIRDAVEPRVKVSGPGCVFPGVLGPVETVGEGRTNRLSGVTVMVSAQYRPTMTGGYGAQNSSVLDMWGPGSQMSPFGSMINIILILQLVENVTEVDAHTAIQLAELKVANRLAEATRHETPTGMELFELFEVDPSLPRIVYILGAETEWPYPHTGIAFYGMPIDVSLPTFVHPNEFLDGAVTTDARHGSSIFVITWAYMNQPVVLELFREHGKRINFLGVILQRTRFTSEHGKRVTAAVTSQMARLLRADGSINTGMVASGNNFMDVMWTVEACEKKGVKTVLITPEWGSTEDDIALPFFVPEATAIVSTGVHGRELKLPGAPAKVIGAREGQLATHMVEEPPFSPWSEIKFDNYWGLTLGCDWFGGMNYTCKEY